MNKSPKPDTAPSLPTLAMIAGAVSTSFVGPNVRFGQALASPPAKVQSGSMTPQDQEFVMARVDAKVADLRTDVRLNTQGLKDLKERFDDFAKRMEGVPTSVATITERVSHLPTKDELGTKLRNYMLLGVALIGMLISAATFVLKFVPAGASAAT